MNDSFTTFFTMKLALKLATTMSTIIYFQQHRLQLAFPLHASTEVLDMPDLEENVATMLTSRVILFNDEFHTFDDVIGQILKATRCSLSKAEKLTLEVHHKGKAMVYEGEFAECLRVSTILEEIELRTQIEC
jgi:ATP-dependent Clp protease adaptor protein ClpS